MKEIVKNNATLKLVLKYFKENGITSIESAMKNKIAHNYVEPCDYKVKIPVENYFPETINEDLEELDESNLFKLSNYRDGKNISFCVNEVQFELLLSMNEEK
jgi:hypothetical protein